MLRPNSKRLKPKIIITYIWSVTNLSGKSFRYENSYRRPQTNVSKDAGSLSMRLQIAYEIPLDNLVNYEAYSLPKKKISIYSHRYEGEKLTSPPRYRLHSLVMIYQALGDI